MGSGFRVWVSGLGLGGLAFRVKAFGFRVKGLGLGFMVGGLVFRVKGLGGASDLTPFRCTQLCAKLKNK